MFIFDRIESIFIGNFTFSLTLNQFFNAFLISFIELIELRFELPILASIC